MWLKFLVQRTQSAGLQRTSIEKGEGDAGGAWEQRRAHVNIRQIPGRLLRGGDLNEFEREPDGFLSQQGNIFPLDYTDLALASEILCSAFPLSPTLAHALPDDQIISRDGHTHRVICLRPKGPAATTGLQWASHCAAQYRTQCGTFL